MHRSLRRQALGLLASAALATAAQAGSPWLYRLQAGSSSCDQLHAELAAADSDLLVIDQACEGTPWTRDQVEALKTSPSGAARPVLSYLSIGEAEDYRSYWRSGFRPGNPSWLDAENPRWKGNYFVRYWETPWKNIVVQGPFTGPGGAREKSLVDRVVDAGFDGLYLDIVDGYQRYQDERPGAKVEMVDLVEAIAARARTRAGREDFLVLPQNASELVDDAEVGSRFRAAISGIAVEETWFLSHDEARPAAETAAIEARLDQLVAAGKLVLTVDYCRDAGNAAEVRERAAAKGYRAYVTTDELDRNTPQS